MPGFDIARLKLLGAEEAAINRKMFEDQFLSGFRVPEAATQSVLNTRTNRFGIDELNQNYETNLETSRLDAQNLLVDAQRTSSLSDLQTDYESGQLRSRIAANESSRLQSQFEIDNFNPDHQKLMQDISELSALSELETQVNVNQFKSIQESVGPIGLDNNRYGYFTAMYQRMDDVNASSQVRAILNADYLKYINSQSSTFRQIHKLYLAGELNGGMTSSQIVDYTSKISNLDVETIQLGIAQGILNINDLPTGVVDALSESLAPIEPVIQQPPIEPVIQQPPIEPVIQQPPIEPVIQQPPIEPVASLVIPYRDDGMLTKDTETYSNVKSILPQEIEDIIDTVNLNFLPIEKIQSNILDLSNFKDSLSVDSSQLNSQQVLILQQLINHTILELVSRLPNVN